MPKQIYITIIFFLFSLFMMGQTTVTPVDGATINSDNGVINYGASSGTRYSLFQHIFSRSSINTSGNITDIQFENQMSGTFTNVKIYMAETSKASFTGGSDWVNTGLTLVYSGNLIIANGFYNITLNTPFAYTNTNNLLIVVHQDGGNALYNTNARHLVSAVGTNLTLRNQGSSSLGVYGSWSSFGTRSGELPSLKLIFSPVPTITSLGSTSGCAGSSTLDINGTNLSGVSSVKIGGTNVSSIVSNTATKIVAIVGAGTTGSVVVTTASGTATSVATYAVLPAITIASAGADQGPACASSTTLAANAVISGETGTWSIINAGGTIAGINSPTTTVSGLGIGSNIFRWTVSNGTCTNYDDITVSINTATINTPQAGNTFAITSWVNPPCSFDEMMVVARATSSATGLPSGNGSSYTANGSYGSGTSFGGGFVVYKGNGTIQNITSLTNGTIYYLTYYVRVGTVWTYIDVKPVTPNNTTVYFVNDASTTSDIYCTAPGAAFNLSTNDGISSNKPCNKVQDILDNYFLSSGNIVLIDHGNYAESFTITASDMGSSSGDVKFIGAGYTKTVFDAASASNNVDIITEVDYILIEGIRFNNSNVNYHNIYRNYGDYFKVKNCYLNINSTTGSTSSNIYLRAINNNFVGGDYCQISGNIIENSAENGYGIRVYGDNNLCTFDNNTITMTGASGNGMYFHALSGTYSFWPTRNTISNNTVNSIKTALYFAGISDTRNLVSYNVFGNVISVSGNTDASNSGIYLYAFGTMSGSDAPTNIYNNRIIGGYAGIFIDNMTDGVNYYNNYICASKYGLYSYDDYLETYVNKLYHNSFYTTASCLFFEGFVGSTYYNTQEEWDIRNNIFYSTSNSTSRACIEFANPRDASNSKVDYLNYNIFYAPNGTNIAKWGSYANYSTLASWQAADMAQFGTNDPNSLNVDPKYMDCAVCNLDITPADQRTGVNVSIATDLMGTSRVKPAIGAFESRINTLPIALVNFDFTCHYETLKLNWSTASETNNDYFVVLGSDDALEWTEVGKIAGANNSNTKLNYYFNIPKYYSNLNYYKLNQVDFDNSYSYSNILYVDCQSKNKIEIFPNPFADELNLKVYTNELVPYQISTILNQVVNSGYVNSESSTIKLSELPSGIYFIKVNNSNPYKIIKQ